MDEELTVEECKKMYCDLLKYKQGIANIDTDFFFKFSEVLLLDICNKEEKINELKDALDTFGREII